MGDKQRTAVGAVAGSEPRGVAMGVGASVGHLGWKMCRFRLGAGTFNGQTCWIRGDGGNTGST